MSIASTFTQVELLPHENYQVILVDEFVTGITGVELVSQMRLLGWPNNAEFWFSAYDKEQSHPTVQEAMSAINATRYFRKPVSALDIKQALISLNSSHTPSVSSGTLRMVGQIWASKSTVLLQSDTAKVFFSMGAVVHQDPEDGLISVLREISPRVIRTNIPAGGNWLETGMQLLNVPLVPPRTWLLEHHFQAVQHASFSSSISKLELCNELTSALKNTEKSSINDWSQEAKNECYKLWTMGFISFAEARQEISRGRPTQPRTTLIRNPVVLLRQLEAEWERIETAEPWAVLGLSQTASGGLIQETVERLTFRYSEIFEKPRQREDIEKLARKIHAHILGSASQWQQTSESGRQPEHIRLLNIAKKMFNQQEYHKAEHLLKRALSLVLDNASIHAWKGWVILHNSEHEEKSAALDSLLYAISLEPQNQEALFFLVQYYRRKNQPEQALNPARQLKLLNPTTESEELLALINKEIRELSD